MKLKFILSLAVMAAVSCSPARAAPADAEATANGPLCAMEAPFYWEIGDKDKVIVSGSVKAPGGRKTFERESVFQVASASKWFYGAYVNEVRKGLLTPEDVKFLTFKSGYSAFEFCDEGETVEACSKKATYRPRSDGKFYYSGGHMQVHATKHMGMGAMNSAELAASMNRVLGVFVSYSQPQPAGGIVTTPAGYANLLQRIMSDTLHDGRYLASNPVQTKGQSALFSPVPETWRYGRGHWIETDGSFSSPGAFGFYPWISKDKRLYGIVARHDISGAWDSVLCGREIRRSFLK